MSADNWGICPRCASEAIKEKQALASRIQQAYGEVSEREYLNLMLEQQEPIQLEPYLREDYEIFMSETGEFYIRYSCCCTVCDFSHQFKKTEQVFKA